MCLWMCVWLATIKAFLPHLLSYTQRCDITRDINEFLLTRDQNRPWRFSVSLPSYVLFLFYPYVLTSHCFHHFKSFSCIHLWFFPPSVLSTLLFSQFKWPQFSVSQYPITLLYSAHFLCLRVTSSCVSHFSSLYVNDHPAVTPGDENRKCECFPSIFESKACGNMYLIITSFQRQKNRHANIILTVNMSWHPPNM